MGGHQPAYKNSANMDGIQQHDTSIQPWHIRAPYHLDAQGAPYSHRQEFPDIPQNPGRQDISARPFHLTMASQAVFR